MERLGLRKAEESLRVVEQYYPRIQILPKTRFAVEELCQEFEEP